MRHSLTSRKAGNWVDRGASPLPVMQRMLEFFFERHGPEDQEWQRRAAEDVYGMVAADATDIHVAGYLKSVARSQGLEFAKANHGPRGDRRDVAECDEPEAD